MIYQGLNLMICPRTYLVLVTETLVAQDIAQTITDFDPASKVICAGSLAAAEVAVAAEHAIEIAFVAGNPGQFAQSALHRGLIARGSRVVLLGYEAEASGPTPVFDVLQQPFDTAAVVAKLLAGQHSYA